jgi:hypothetical protein
MRDLTKCKIVKSWYPSTGGSAICQLYQGKKGAQYIGFVHRFPDGRPYYRDFRDMRQTQIVEAIRMIGDYLTEGKVAQSTAEIVLDLLYAELNRRMVK